MEEGIQDMRDLCDFTRTIINRGQDIQVGYSSPLKWQWGYKERDSGCQ